MQREQTWYFIVTITDTPTDDEDLFKEHDIIKEIEHAMNDLPAGLVCTNVVLNDSAS